MCIGGERTRRLRVLQGGVTGRVLIVAGDPDRRARVLDELTQTLPAGTDFVEADTAAAALARAAGCETVVIGGPVTDAPMDTLARLLARRHPTVTVMNMAVSGSR